MRDVSTTPHASPKRWNPLRIRIRTLALMIAAIAASLGTWRFQSQNADPHRAWISHQFRALLHDDPNYRRTATEALSVADGVEVRKAAPAMIALLAKDPDSAVRRAAAEALGKLLPRGSEVRDESIAAEVRAATGVLIGALADTDAGARQAAIINLGLLHFGSRNPAGEWVGPDPAPVIQALGEVAGDPDLAVRAAALRCIGWLIPYGQRVPTILLDALDDPDESVRIAVLQALGLIGWSPDRGWKNAGEVALRITRRLESSQGDERTQLVVAVDRLGEVPPISALSEFLHLLEDEDALPYWARPSLARILGRYGEVAQPALPGLRRLAEQEIDPGQYPLPAVEAIFRIAPDSPEAQAMAEALAKLHRETQLSSIASDVASMLAGLGPSARVALPILRQTAQTGQTPTQREQASRAIEAIEARGE